MGEILTHSVFLTMKSRPPQLSFPTLNFFNNSSSKTRYAVRKRTTSVWKPMTLPQLYSETNSADFVKFWEEDKKCPPPRDTRQRSAKQMRPGHCSKSNTQNVLLDVTGPRLTSPPPLLPLLQTRLNPPPLEQFARGLLLTLANRFNEC